MDHKLPYTITTSPVPKRTPFTYDLIWIVIFMVLWGIIYLLAVPMVD